MFCEFKCDISYAFDIATVYVYFINYYKQLTLHQCPFHGTETENSQQVSNDNPLH